MKKILAITATLLAILGIYASAHAATPPAINSLLSWNGTIFTSTTSPTVGYVTATSTVASQLPYASSTASSASTFCLLSNCISVWPTGTGGGGSGNVGTSSVPVIGNLAYWTTTTATPALLGTVATTSIGCTGLISCTGFYGLGAASTISYTGNNWATTSSNYWLTSTSSPLQVGSITATSTATSTFAHAVFAPCFSTDNSTCLTSGAGTNYWTLSGSNLYNNSGTKVGINATTPGARLEIDSDNSVTGQLILKDTAGASNSTPMLAFENSSGNNLGLFDSYGRMYLNAGQLSWLAPTGVDVAIGASARVNVSPAAIFAGASGQSVPVLQIQNYSEQTNASISDNGSAYFGGNVGIATSSPYAPLSVVGKGGVVAESFTATSTTATSTFTGPVVIGSGTTGTLAVTSTSTLSGNTVIGGQITSYNGVSDLDVPIVVAKAHTSASTTTGTLLSYTPPSDGYYDIRIILNVSAISVDTIRTAIHFTDPDSIANWYYVCTAITSAPAGCTSNLAVAVKGGTTITAGTELVTSGGSVTYSAASTIIKETSY